MGDGCWVGEGRKSATPWKTNMEPKNHPIGKEHDLPNLHFWVQNVNFPGCNPQDSLEGNSLNAPICDF